VGWTLCFEMLFYAAFAIGLATRPVIPIIAFAVCLLLGARTPFLAFVGSPLILEFLAGILIAKLPPTKLAPVLILASALWFAIAPTDYYTATYGSHAALRVIAWGIPAAFLVYGALSVETLFAGRLFAIPVLVGNASYSIYLLGIVTFTHPVPPDAENSGFSSREVLANSRHSPLRN
jgi:exopolysaccharide production protein ExoZ